MYNEAVFAPLLDAMGERLRPDVKLRAEIFKTDADAAVRQFEEQLGRLREHLQKRREFLLAQTEMKTAGAFSTEGLEKSVKKKKEKTPKL